MSAPVPDVSSSGPSARRGSFVRASCELRLCQDEHAIPYERHPANPGGDIGQGKPHDISRCPSCKFLKEDFLDPLQAASPAAAEGSSVCPSLHYAMDQHGHYPEPPQQQRFENGSDHNTLASTMSQQVGQAEQRGDTGGIPPPFSWAPPRLHGGLRWAWAHLTPTEPSQAELESACLTLRALRQHHPGLQADTCTEEENCRTGNLLQQRPIILPTRTAEVAFVAISCVGQGLFSHFLGNAMVLQKQLIERFHMPNSQAPWLSGAFSLANGVMVVVAGALADIYGARIMILSSLFWLTCVSAILGTTVANTNGVVYLVHRAFLGLGVAGMTSASISYLGRVYKPGRRKNIVFSIMGGLGPTGYLTGGILAGAFEHNLPWVSGVNAIITGTCFFLALRFAPTERTICLFERISGAQAHPPRRFDWLGACTAVAAVSLIVFGLTQGSSAHWSPYTYITIILGILLLPVFIYVESRVKDPIIPNNLWRIKLFPSLSLIYFLSIAAFTSFQFYAIQFWLWFQGADALHAALYLVPNFVAGLLATFSVGRLFHLLPGQFIFGAGCLATILGCMFFLLNNPNTSYFAFSMVGIFISTFTPDLSFAAASIFVTSNVSRRYQGVAGSILVTLQNISQAIMTSLSDTVGSAVTNKGYEVLSATLKPEYRHVGLNGTSWMGPGGQMQYGTRTGTTMEALQAVWWFDLAGALLALVLSAVLLRIPKEDEREHLD